jgi:thiol-disulfide isomerase/thioredoxin
VIRRVLLLVGALVAAVVLAGCSTAPSADNGFTFNGTGGRPAVTYDPPSSRGVLPAVSGESLLEPGRMISTDAYRGQVVVLNVWGSWCGPCRGEADDLESVARASAPRGVQFLGIDVRDDRDAASDFVRDRGVPYPSLYDQPGRSLLVLRGYPRNAVPSTIVLDRSHRVAAVFLTAVLASELQGAVDRVAAEPAAP